MKVKEQLAAQYLGTLKNIGGLSRREMRIFIAGFEKAREMVIQKMVGDAGALFRLRDLGEDEIEEDKNAI